MRFVIIALLFICAISALVLTLFFNHKNSNNYASKNIVDSFEPDNLSPELTEMINFHKENGNVDYKI